MSEAVRRSLEIAASLATGTKEERRLAARHLRAAAAEIEAAL